MQSSENGSSAKKAENAVSPKESKVLNEDADAADVSRAQTVLESGNEPEEATTFKDFQPVVERKIELPAVSNLPSLFGGTEIILFAEDEDSLRKLAVEILELMGYTVLTAKNGQEAVALFETNRERIDLLLFDLIMPQMGGSEAAKRIRALESDVPLIFMTGNNSETARNQMSGRNRLTEEANETIIQKPYSVQELGRIIRETLDKTEI